MKKSVFCLLLATLLFCLSACAPTPNVGVDSSNLEPLVIGGIGPLTGSFASVGLSVRNGAQIAVEEINATGGVNGFRLVLNFLDSKNDPKTAVSIYDRLIANDMKVLLGGVFSEETAAVAPLAADDGIPVVVPTASGESILGEGGNVFRVCVNNSRLGAAVAEFAMKSQLGSNIAVIYADDEYGGAEIAHAFFDASEEDEVTVQSALLPKQPSGQNILQAVASLRGKTPPDVLVLALSPRNTEIFFRYYSRFPMDASVIAFSSVDHAVNFLGEPMSLDGTYVVTSFSPHQEEILSQNFTENYTEAYGVAPDRAAADAYDAVYAIAEALRKGGLTPGQADDEDFGPELIAAMTKIEVRGVTGTLSWTPDGETTRPVRVMIWQDGACVPLPKDGE